MSEAMFVAQKLGGVKTASGWLCRCPLPNHGKGRGDVNRSLLIKDGQHRLLVNCRAGCDRRDVLAELLRRGVLDGGDRRPINGFQLRQVALREEPSKDARGHWGRGKALQGTLGEKYLAARGLILAPPSLRFVPTARYESGIFFPAIVAAVQAPDCRVIATQLIFIDPSGRRKAAVPYPRKNIGTLGSGAVRLAAATDVLGLAEGTEKAIAAMQLTNIPCWSTLGAPRLHRVWIPETVQELHVFGDNDNAGRAAAERTVAAHPDRRVVLRFPPQNFKDWDEVTAANIGASEG
jgi:putative DNA primase/helicase